MTDMTDMTDMVTNDVVVNNDDTNMVIPLNKDNAYYFKKYGGQSLCSLTDYPQVFGCFVIVCYNIKRVIINY